MSIAPPFSNPQDFQNHYDSMLAGVLKRGAVTVGECAGLGVGLQQGVQYKHHYETVVKATRTLISDLRVNRCNTEACANCCKSYIASFQEYFGFPKATEVKALFEYNHQQFDTLVDQLETQTTQLQQGIAQIQHVIDGIGIIIIIGNIALTYNNLKHYSRTSQDIEMYKTQLIDLRTRAIRASEWFISLKSPTSDHINHFHTQVMKMMHQFDIIKIKLQQIRTDAQDKGIKSVVMGVGSFITGFFLPVSTPIMAAGIAGSGFLSAASGLLNFKLVNEVTQLHPLINELTNTYMTISTTLAAADSNLPTF